MCNLTKLICTFVRLWLRSGRLPSYGSISVSIPRRGVHRVCRRPKSFGAGFGCAWECLADTSWRPGKALRAWSELCGCLRLPSPCLARWLLLSNEVRRGFFKKRKHFSCVKTNSTLQGQCQQDDSVKLSRGGSSHFRVHCSGFHLGIISRVVSPGVWEVMTHLPGQLCTFELLLFRGFPH